MEKADPCMSPGHIHQWKVVDLDILARIIIDRFQMIVMICLT